MSSSSGNAICSTTTKSCQSTDWNAMRSASCCCCASLRFSSSWRVPSSGGRCAGGPPWAPFPSRSPFGHPRAAIAPFRVRVDERREVTEEHVRRLEEVELRVPLLALREARRGIAGPLAAVYCAVSLTMSRSMADMAVGFENENWKAGGASFGAFCAARAIGAMSTAFLAVTELPHHPHRPRSHRSAQLSLRRSMVPHRHPQRPSVFVPPPPSSNSRILCS